MPSGQITYPLIHSASSLPKLLFIPFEVTFQADVNDGASATITTGHDYLGLITSVAKTGGAGGTEGSVTITFADSYADIMVFVMNKNKATTAGDGYDIRFSSNTATTAVLLSYVKQYDGDEAGNPVSVTHALKDCDADVWQCLAICWDRVPEAA